MLLPSRDVRTKKKLSAKRFSDMDWAHVFLSVCGCISMPIEPRIVPFSIYLSCPLRTGCIDLPALPEHTHLSFRSMSVYNEKSLALHWNDVNVTSHKTLSIGSAACF